MSRARVHNLSISLDGFATGEGQTRARVVVFPVITGRTGKDRIYDPDVSLDMVESRTFDGRLQLLEYVPTVLHGPPARGRTNP